LNSIYSYYGSTGSLDWELKEIAILIERQIELGHFQIKCIRAKDINTRVCKIHRQPYEGKMTPQEELFSKLFNDEKQLVKDMSDLELRAHREELSKIGFEARARLTADDDEEKVRKSKNKKSTGFERSVTTDDVSSDAINAINTRKTKLTKIEKTIDGLVKLGMSRADAEKMCSAGVILGQMRKQSDDKPAATIANPFSLPLEDRNKAEEKASEDEMNNVNNPANRTEKPLVNPFAK